LLLLALPQPVAKEREISFQQAIVCVPVAQQSFFAVDRVLVRLREKMVALPAAGPAQVGAEQRSSGALPWAEALFRPVDQALPKVPARVLHRSSAGTVALVGAIRAKGKVTSAVCSVAIDPAHFR
jgi:hypothetical protein